MKKPIYQLKNHMMMCKIQYLHVKYVYRTCAGGAKGGVPGMSIFTCEIISVACIVHMCAHIGRMQT